MTKATTFEETYPCYPFAPLVRLGIGLAAQLSGRSDRNRGGANDEALAGAA